MAEVKFTLHCRAAGCEKHANRKGPALCEAHYMKLRRYGDINYKHTPKEVVVHSGGYILQAAKGHKLALGGYRAYQHRLVFHEHHGDGPFDCHWCGKVVTWNYMHVDHLNDMVNDNRPENLVASCPACNMHRNEESHRALWRRKFGLTVGGQTKTISEWAAAIGISPVSLKARIAAGWDLARAVTQPRGKTGPVAVRHEATGGARIDPAAAKGTGRAGA